MRKDRGRLNSSAASSYRTCKACSPTGVHYDYDTTALNNVTDKAIVGQGGDTWFFLTADYAFGHALERDVSKVVKEEGGKVLGAVRHPFPNQDFSSFLLQAQASKAKIIGLANNQNARAQVERLTRSEARRVGKECVSTGRSRRAP